ncbi:hypothetical protein ABZ639_02560 [Saccharomonospora sp. NPDC006951]
MTTSLTTTLASDIWLTPFGIPFDTAVLAGLVLTALAILLAGRRHKGNSDSENGDRS